nr:Arm DNA-binding domain-containing protein [Candidatus Kapabacteria bacterium]
MKSKITIRLYLQYPNIQKKLSPILISVSWSGERVFKSTGVSVFPGDWDKRKADIKNSADNAQAISMYLSNIQKSVSEFHFDNLRNSVYVSKIDMRKQIDLIIQNAKNSGGSKTSFFDYYDMYI